MEIAVQAGGAVVKVGDAKAEADVMVGEDVYGEVMVDGRNAWRSQSGCACYTTNILEALLICKANVRRNG